MGGPGPASIAEKTLIERALKTLPALADFIAMDSSRGLMGVFANNERLDRAAGRTLGVLYGMQVLGGSVAFWLIGLVGWVIGSAVVLVFGVVVGSGLFVAGVRSLSSKNRLSDLNPDGEGIEFD